jgi:hypothetical protein
VVAIVDEVGFSLQDAMIWDLPRVAESEHLVLLPEWESSSGAKAERFVGEMTGSRIWLAVPREVLAWRDQAKQEGLDAVIEWDLVLDDVQKRLAGPQLIEVSILRSISIGEETLKATQALRPVHEIVAKSGGEVRVVDPTTGGAKGSKLARFDLVPWDAMTAVAEHYGRGARKYAERNWERGYNYSLSYAAAMRHLVAFWNGEDVDPDPSLYTVDGEVVEPPSALHIAAAAWHCLNLLAFHLRGDGTDDRPVRENG